MAKDLGLQGSPLRRFGDLGLKVRGFRALRFRASGALGLRTWVA